VSNSKRGVTLLEVVLALLLAGIIAGITLPRIGVKDFTDRVRLRTIAFQIASDVRYARRLAITEAKNYSIIFQPVPRDYDIKETGTATSIGRDFPKDLPSGISVSGQLQFDFQWLGDVAVPGTLIVSGYGQSFDVTVEDVSGAVIVE
jgi:prepilin-type N-terminal cleavage/methylation domain-containing protein